MPIYDVGDRVYKYSVATASFTFQPLLDRAAIVKRILIDKPSASDVWIISVQGREVARFDIQTTGNQQPLAGPMSGYPKCNDLFQFYNTNFPDDLIYPVPQGQTMTISSVGAATANVSIGYTEVNNSELSVGMMNHPLGQRFITPLVIYRAANVTAQGESAFDTQVGPNWFPNLGVDNTVPATWSIKIIAMFLEGGGRNAYTGSADTQTVTTYMGVIKDGLRLYTRDALGGIPIIGQASATGSANTVTSSDETPYPAFQETDWYDSHVLERPLVFQQGEFYQFRLATTGAATPAANMSTMRQMFLCDVRTTGIAV